MRQLRTICIAVWLALAVAAQDGSAQVVVDNDDGAPGYVETGGWVTSGTSGYDGGTYRFANDGAASTATWTANLTSSGVYEIFVWYRPGSNRTTSTHYIINTADGPQNVYINQQAGGYTWDSLGSFTFNAGNNSIVLDAATSTGGDVVIADAVRFGGDSGPPIDPPTPVEVAPGVYHSTWALPQPQVNHVLEFDLADPQYTIEMGFAQGNRYFTAKQPVSQMVTYYDEPGHEVVGAINASFFGASIEILGMLGSGGNLISSHPGSAGLEQTYMLQQSGEGWAGSGLDAANMVAKFANGTEVQIDDLDYTCTTASVQLYTPDWGTTTHSTAVGTEIIVEGVNYPARPNKWLTGTITAVKTGFTGINNAIPPDGFVLAACGGADGEILPHAVVGEKLSVRFGMSPFTLANLQTLVTGNVWIVKDGVAYQPGESVRHPRTVIAWSGTKHWFVTFDGRQPGYSVGASTAEEADFLINALGVENAINLDGGGSTTMVINGEVVNCPSDQASTPCTGVERTDPNALMLIRRIATSDLPLADAFPAEGRELNWDDKFTTNGVEAFAPAAPDGDGTVLRVRDTDGGYETVSSGAPGDANYAVEAWIYCDYRPELAGDGYERAGIFARDDGNANFEATSAGGGNCYALTYDSHDGRVRAAVVVDGVMTDFLEGTPLNLTSSGWRRMRIACSGSSIRYFIDGAPIANVTNTARGHGRCGIGHHEYFTTNANAQGAIAENFLIEELLLLDADLDGDVDLADLAAFEDCLLGPDVDHPPADPCLELDTDGDDDVDLADFEVLQGVFTG